MADADVVVSAVTAANTLVAAEKVAGSIPVGSWYVDLNSASPNVKRSAAEAVTAVGGRYVEVAVMSPIEPKRLAAPMLLGGPHAREFSDVARTLGLSGMTFYADTLGLASATKLSRSIVVKGLEALLTESMLAARTWGVERYVLDSLENMIPGIDWTEFATYMVSRPIVHGIRRAEEMREAAQMVADAGVEPLMAEATSSRQARSGELRGIAIDDLADMVDALRKTSGLATTSKVPSTD